MKRFTMKVRKCLFHGNSGTISENKDYMVYCDDFHIIGWIVVLSDCHGLVCGLLAGPSMQIT